jgi:hypothetical protein
MMKKLISIMCVVFLMFAVGAYAKGRTLDFQKTNKEVKEDVVTYTFEVKNISQFELDVEYLNFVIADADYNPEYAIKIEQPLHLFPGETSMITFDVDKNITVVNYKFTFFIKSATKVQTVASI